MAQTYSLLIKNKLLDEIIARFGDLSEIRHRIHRRDSSLIADLVDTIDTVFDLKATEWLSQLGPSDRTLVKTLSSDKLFCRRVKQTVIESVYSEPLCPPLLIQPSDQPFSIVNQTTPPALIHGVCIEYLSNCTNELYPLMIDSYVSSLTSRIPFVQVAGFHHSWLNREGEVIRGILYLPETDELIETRFDPPLELSSIHYLAISPIFHKEISGKMEARHVREVNPYLLSALADDKFRCFHHWVEAGIPTPQARLIEAATVTKPKRLAAVLEKQLETLSFDETCKSIVLQPNKGTEGRGTRLFSFKSSWKELLDPRSDLLAHAERVLTCDDLLIRPGVGAVLLVDNLYNQYVHFDIRINVIRGQAESGFIMLAAPSRAVSSPEQGGRIVEIDPHFSWNLRGIDHSDPVIMNEADWRRILKTAEAAASILPDCQMVGVDIRLDWKKSTIHPWVLDINPRPAGLAHSRYFDTREPGVTRSLWQTLVSMQ